MHLNDVLATIGLEQLKYVDLLVNKQRRGAEYYYKNLQNMKEIRVLKEPDGCKSSYWLFTVLVERREKFINTLNAYGIECSPVHQRNDKLSIFGKLDKSLKNTDIFNKKAVCLPNGYWVSQKDRRFIVDTIKRNFA
ncbi:UDP-4-amino-4, 6-dideoxy-N-acetyl-beta-L-altrosamine transaminase [bacterium HR35]|nr:UDP-4-amino-4, 6-dideoxy-N-acetyl-beta-L-altrosamine transaminase [bacterium HR35]